MPRPKEKPIHFGVFLGIGIAMFVISRILLARESTQHPEAMQLFSWIGVLFLVIGIIKLIIHLNKKGAFKGEEKFAQQLAGPQANPNALQEQERARQLHQQRLRQEELRRRNVQGGNNQQSSSNSTHNQSQVKSEVTIITCPLCKTKNYSSSNFCHMCGQRLK